ncbi:A24 family peptidase [Methylobacterium organophilum]|uniref:Prepilin type IV endopeptidase peptidase domain-containing protein n=1 Tax=Methylobacterium organophilum TaxID=410 RepID=A0ABQ4T5F0_METOR|nr:prepilin peptidase [Methylobacterium organophilum]UMY19005.1 prepilin peptidase [Methylobacterium organophilum]GJE25461.1 hypothetical protein LKMONMHP_0299 [Methylobacterium organophilum]
MVTFALCIVFPFLMAYAAASDLLTMLIPNRVNLLVMLSFVLYVVGAGLGWAEIGNHVAAGALTLLLTFTLFALGYIGGGDAKLAAATALWIGLDHMADYLLVASVFGGALTLLILYMRTYPLPGFTARLPFALHLHDAKTGIPYGIALAAAALAVLPMTQAWQHLPLG